MTCIKKITKEEKIDMLENNPQEWIEFHLDFIEDELENADAIAKTNLESIKKELEENPDEVIQRTLQIYKGEK